jgi:beta-xylosidase
MNKRQTLLLIVLACLIINAKNYGQEDREEIYYADPTIYVENGKYHLTGTRTAGFGILISEDLKNWKSPMGKSSHLVLEKDKGTFGTKGFWAPQFFKEDGKYYITYTANEQTCLASSDSIMGPFTQAKIEPIDGSEKNIDSYIFRDDDGKHYLYHVRFNQGNYLWVAEFDMKTGKINTDTLTKCFNQTDDWEATPTINQIPLWKAQRF